MFQLNMIGIMQKTQINLEYMLVNKKDEKLKSITKLFELVIEFSIKTLILCLKLNMYNFLIFRLLKNRYLTINVNRMATNHVLLIIMKVYILYILYWDLI